MSQGNGSPSLTNDSVLYPLKVKSAVCGKAKSYPLFSLVIKVLYLVSLPDVPSSVKFLPEQPHYIQTCRKCYCFLLKKEDFLNRKIL